MDVHIVPGVKAKDVAEAHRLDLLQQEEHKCKCMTYWIDETRESIFCLIEAPDKESVVTLHEKAHGLVPNKVIEVNPDLVETFLGRIYDPSNATINDDGLKVFSDPSFRVLLVTKTNDPVLLQHCLGKENAYEILKRYQEITRVNILKNNGREAEHAGSEFIVSFSSAAKALACATAIQKEVDAEEANEIGLRMAIHAGEPVGDSNKLFGDTIQFATQLCGIADEKKIAVSSEVRELLSKDSSIDTKSLLSLPPQDEELLQKLYAILEAHWQESEFDMEEYCQSVAMSKSQLYRKTISLTGVSPNQLLKDFRLENAKELMRKKRYNIAQITFESGFTSPSYFTKCFKKKYGLLPMGYVDLLH